MIRDASGDYQELTGKYPVADGKWFLVFGKNGGANYDGEGQMLVRYRAG